MKPTTLNARCSGCGKTYVPKRLPAKNRRRYCEDCGHRAAMRDAARAYRSRKAKNQLTPKKQIEALKAKLAEAYDLLFKVHPGALQMRLDPIHKGHSFYWSVKCIDCVPTAKRRRELERQRLPRTATAVLEPDPRTLAAGGGR
jgi:DNA-directed RNA polymerase subunit RPC12/RpoP